MNEIEKLYENAGLSNMWVEEYNDKQFWHKSYNKMIESMMKINDWSRKVAVEVAKKECRKALPLFTAEKQLELIKFLGDVRDYTVEIDKFKGVYYVGCRSAGSNDKLWGSSNTFEDALAELINETWFCLTEEEKEQIRGILNANI